MKILVTGSRGFIGKNLVLHLQQHNYEVLEFDREIGCLEELVKQCDFVMHLAGINRPLNKEEFYNGNTNLTFRLIELLKQEKRNIPLLFSSSIQAELENDYGKSKKQAEDLVFDYGRQTNSKVYIYRLANVFGKWCKPNYNSVIATFCYNVAHDLEIKVNDPQALINFVYIDDVCHSFIKSIDAESSNEYLSAKPIYPVLLGDLANKLTEIKTSRNNKKIYLQKDGFDKKLYATYLSYLPTTDFSYNTKMNIDERGSFTELFKTDNYGQVSINIIKPGITKGNHWHHTKNEKFVVVKGKAAIRFRKINENEVHEYICDGENIQIVDIPVGYTHNIENIGNTDCVCIMWANECFKPDAPDTFWEKV